MLTIEIICAGRIKESYYTEACLEYAKRLNGMVKLSVIEQPEGKPLQFVQDRAYTIALTPDGKLQSSEQFCDELWELADSGISKIRFLIGGSDGLFEEDLQRADAKKSLSPMTFTHAMARVLLLEQIYRACMIRNGRKYHK